jgi:hypothetical protein
MSNESLITYAAWRETESFSLERSAFDELNRLFQQLFEVRLRPINANSYQPYALFHYIANSQKLVTTIGAILRRMVNDSESYRRAIKQEDLKRAEGRKTRALVFTTADESPERFRELLIADFELIYTIANRLLDQWALIVSHISATPKPREENFNSLIKQYVQCEQDHLLWRSLLGECREIINWVYAHVLVFRDKFIIHQTKPFQQSTITDLATGYLRISYLIDPIWLGDEAKASLHKRILDVNSCAPPNIQLDLEQVSNPNFVIGHLFEHYEQFEPKLQDELVSIAKDNGFTAPNFLLLSHKIFNFVARTIPVVSRYTDCFWQINLWPSWQSKMLPLGF